MAPCNNDCGYFGVPQCTSNCGVGPSGKQVCSCDCSCGQNGEVFDEITFQDVEIREKRRKIAFNNLQNIVHLVSSDAIIKGFPFTFYLNDPSRESYEIWFKNLEKSVLSLTEQKNLLQNVTSQVLSYNNLND